MVGAGEATTYIAEGLYTYALGGVSLLYMSYRNQSAIQSYG
jgi:hypothetical protein